MDEQILKDLVATAQSDNYDWNNVLGKFPELQSYDSQLLKDYVATAEKHDYDYSVVNSKFPEFSFGKKKEEPAADLSTSSEVSDSETPSTEPKKTLSTEEAVNLIQKEEGKSLWESFSEVVTKKVAALSGALDWGGVGVAAASTILDEYAAKEAKVVAARKKVEEEAFKAPEQTVATHQADVDRLSLLDDYLAHPKSPKYLSKDSEFSSRVHGDVKAERDELSIKVSPFVAPIQKIKNAQWFDNNAVEYPYGAREDVSTGEVTEVEEPSIALYKQYLREENPTALSDFETAQKEADKDVATSQRSAFMQKANDWYRETLSNSLSIKGEKTITSPDGQQTSVKDVIKGIEEASTELEKSNEDASDIDDKIKTLIEESKDSVTNGEINTEILNKINAEVSDYANSLFSKVEEEAKNATTQEDIDLLNARYKSDVDAFGVATTDRHLSGFYDIQKKVALLNSQRAKIVEESQSKFSSINTAMSLDEIKDYQNTVSLQGVVAKSTEELLQFDPTALKQHQEREFLQDVLDKEAKEGQLNWNDKAVRWFSGHAVQLAINLATIPRSFSAGGDYDFGEYVGDFVEHTLEPATLTSTDLQRGLYERVVNIDDYKLTLDDEKNVIGVRDKDGFAVKGVEAKSIVSKYMRIPKSQRPKEESEFASDLLFRKSADTMLTMAELVYGGQFATKGLQYMGKLAKAAKATEKASKFIGLTASGFVFEHNGLYNEALEAGLNKNEASNLALVGASAVAMLENISPGEKIFSKAARRKLVGEYMKYLGRGATRRDAIAYGVKAVVKEVGNENLQEISQTIADRVVKMGANSIVGENTFDTKITWEELKETALLTTISSGLLGVYTQGTTVSPSWLETSALYTAATEKDQSKLFDRVDLMIENGQLTQSEGDNAKETIIEARDAYSKIPKGRFSGEKENELFSLLLQRGRIEKLNEEVDPAFRKQGEALIEDINKDIEEVINREEGVEPKKEADPVVSRRGDKQLNEGFEKLQSAETQEQRIAAINSIQNNVAKGAEITPEESVALEDALGALKSEGVDISGVKVGDKLSSGANVQTKIWTDNTGDNTPKVATKAIVSSVIEPEVRDADGKIVKHAVVNVSMESLNKEETEAKIKNLEKKKLLAKELGKDTKVIEREIEELGEYLDSLGSKEQVGEEGAEPKVKPEIKTDKPVVTEKPSKVINDIERRREEEINNYYTAEEEGAMVTDPEYSSVAEQIGASWLMQKDKALALKYYEALMKLDMTHQERHDKMLAWMEKKNFNMRKPLQYIENEIDRINAKYDAELDALEQPSQASEAKKTEIEKERKDDLKDVLGQKVDKDSALATVESQPSQQASEVEVKKAEITELKNKKEKELKNLPSYNWREKVLSAKNIEELAPIVLEVSGKDINDTADFDGNLRGALRTPGVWERAKELLVQDLESIEEFFDREEIEKINARYNSLIAQKQAELDAPEAKKTEIEKERKEPYTIVYGIGDVLVANTYEEAVSKINAKYDAEYVDAVNKGEMTKEQAMQALEEAGRKDSKAYAELKALEGTQSTEVKPGVSKLFEQNRKDNTSVMMRLPDKPVVTEKPVEADVKAEAEVTGEEAERLDRIKEAAQSRILSSSRFGKKGVKALNRLVERLNRAFPNVEVSLDTSQLPVRIKKDFKDGAKGAVWAGKVYINPDTATLDTPIHEFGHIFMLWAKKNSKPLHKKGIELIKGSAYEARVRENKDYKGLSEDAILEEALALAIGEKGAMLEDAEVLKTKKGAWRSDKFKKWLNKLLNVFNKKTEIDPNMTLGEYTDMVAGALLSGKKISDVTTDDIAKAEKSAMFSKADDFKASQESIDSIEEVRNADGKLLAPNGEVSNLSEKNWKLVRTPEFKSWFGNWEKADIKAEDVTLGDRAKNEKLESDSSVVVDSNGEPQVVYHGSPTIDIKEFDRGKSQKSSGLREYGMFFTDNMYVAEVYSSKRQMTMEAMAEIDAKVKDLKEEQLKTKNNQEYNNIEREIIRFESLLGQVYPVFLNIRTAHKFDAEGKTFGDEAYLKMDVGLGYKVASGAPAMEALAGKNSYTRGTTKVDGVVAENIVDLSEVPDYAMDKYRGTTFVVFDEKTDAQIAPEFSKKERNIIDGAVIAMAYEGATELEISKILSEQGYTEEQVSRAYDRVYHVIISNSIVSKNEPGENTVESGDVSIDTDSRGVLKKYMKSLVDFIAGEFRARGRMPKEGWAVIKEKDSRLYAEAAEIAKRREFFESSLKHELSLKYFGKPQTKLTAKERAKFSAFWLLKSKNNEMFEDYSDILKNVDLYLRGGKDKASVGVELANVLDGMRGHVDRLSQYLIDTGVTQGDLALTIKENLGIYLTRTYQVYDDPNWNYETLVNSPYGEKLINNAISYLRRNQHAKIIKQVRDEAVVQFQEGRRSSPELTREETSEMVEDRMRGIVSDILNKKEVNFLGVSSGLSVSDEKILKEQKNIDAPIRALMGEYSDPLYNYMMSAYKIANLVESKKVLTNMKEIGMGKFLWRKSDPSRPKTGTVKISADSSSKMAPLNGIYMEEIAYKELEKVFKSNDEYSKLWWFFVGSIRAGKTILSPATHSKNVIGNIGFVLMNGHYDVASAVLKVYKEKGNLKDAISSVADGQKWNEASLFLLGISEPKTKEEMKAALDRSKRLASLGITGQSVGSRDLKEVGERAGFDFLLSKNISFDKLSSIKGIAKRGRSAATQGVGAAASLYQKEDDMFKIWAFEMERSRYEETLKKKGMSEQEIDEWVAERVKNTYPTYDRVGKIITQLKGLPFAGDFLPFKYESIRTFKNSIIYAVQDSKDPDLREVGGKRIASMVSYWMMKESIGPLLGGLGGGLAYIIPSLFVGDDEEEILKSELSARMFMPSWDENQQIVNFKVNRDGKFEYTVFGASDPHGDMSSLLNQISILTLDEGFNDISQAKALAIALKDYFGSFLSLNIAFESATELVRIAQDSSMPRHRRNKAIKRVLRSISPGFVTQTSDLINATDKSAKITQMATGVRVTEIDPKIYLTIAIKELGAHINDELWHYKNLEDRTSADYDESIGYLDDVVHDMESSYRAAINLGMKESDLDKMLDNYKVGLPKQVKRHIKTGRSSGKWFSRGGKK